MDLETDRQKVRRILADLSPGSGLESTTVAQRANIPLRRVRPELTQLYMGGETGRSAWYVSNYGYTWLYGPKLPGRHRLTPARAKGRM